MLTNPLLLSAFLAMVSAQFFKVLVILLTEKRLVIRRAAETGGMPSSHSATVTALCTSALLRGGQSVFRGFPGVRHYRSLRCHGNTPGGGAPRGDSQ